MSSPGSAKIIFQINLVFLTLILFTNGDLSTGNCKKVGPCTCQFDDGKTVDLTPLGFNTGKPRWTDVGGPDGTYVYSYNPCFAFSEATTGSDGCKDAAACQSSTYSPPDRYKLGTQDTATFIVTTSGNLKMNISYHYQDATILRKTDVMLLCGDTEKFEALGDNVPTQYTYVFKLTSPHACPTSAGGEGGLSTGSILLIIFFVLVAVYLIGGFLYMKFRKGATGTELIPNRDFWVAVPGLVKDGTLFAISPLRQEGKKYESI